MARDEIVKFTANPLRAAWWHLMPGKKITVRWPIGWTKPEPAAGGGFIQYESADPNDHYRPWLEKNVGEQGWDWDWRLGPGVDDLVIKFRKGRERYITMFIMVFTL